ncbi:DUF6611 family protein [Mycolicibacterium komossense]|uniref:SMODS and SLOG-associating 2TM effector domain-containing protein n=1 Tax=Mycolicibacterium komossense TaxID=1779 RepID=A0ABT3CEA9_9MYCO|nr:DUF6611 family protein [Mycolicibacterium komossense]MCV7227809.1 hypothetical protein [Mycolicibacterium komossense]
MEQKRPLRSFGSGRSWGYFDIYPCRYGVTRFRLVMFPPGISPEERRLLRAWRSWPAWGMVVFLATQIWLTHAVATTWATAISTTVWVLSGAVTFALSGGTRTRVRTFIGITVSGEHDEEGRRRLDAARALATELLAADASRAEGVLGESEHEAICWHAYQRLGQLTEEIAAR